MERESNNSLGIQADKCRVDHSGPFLSAGERQDTNHSLWKLMENECLCFPRLPHYTLESYMSLKT